MFSIFILLYSVGENCLILWFVSTWKDNILRATEDLLQASKYTERLQEEHYSAKKPCMYLKHMPSGILNHKTHKWNGKLMCGYILWITLFLMAQKLIGRAHVCFFGSVSTHYSAAASPQDQYKSNLILSNIYWPDIARHSLHCDICYCMRLRVRIPPEPTFFTDAIIQKHLYDVKGYESEIQHFQKW